MPALKQSNQNTMGDSETDGNDDSNDAKHCKTFVSTPLIAVPEKIVFCIDITEDASSKPYLSKSIADGVHGNPFSILKNCLSGFIYNKHSLNKEHAFAVMSLETDSVKWVQDFSNDPKTVIKAISDLNVICQSEPIDTDVMPVFKEIKNRIGSLPEVKVSSVQFPEHIVRLILIYNSSYNIPKIDISNEHFNYLIASDYFVLDILYLHDAPSAENKCQEIFDSLLTISSPRSYVFECSRKIVKLFNSMAKLLAHPCQRYELPDFSEC